MTTQIDMLAPRPLYEYPDWWAKWLEQNRPIYRKFVVLALDAKRNRKMKAWSGWGVVQVIRWRTGLKEKHGQFKIRNEAIAYLSRQAMEDYQELRGFFRVRDGLGNDERAER